MRLLLVAVCLMVSGLAVAEGEENEENLGQRMEWLSRRIGPEPTGGYAAALQTAITKRSEMKEKGLEIQWESMGPTNISGRVSALAIHPSAPSTLWLGAGSGGLWKSTDAGANWARVLTPPGLIESFGVGAITIAPSNPNVIYVGTGHCATQNALFFSLNAIKGSGILKTTDGGATWARIGRPADALSNEWDCIRGIVVAANDPNKVMVAGNYTLRRSLDGGTTWSPRTGDTEICDVTPVPGDAQKLLATGIDAGRVPFALASNDFGATWLRTNLAAAQVSVGRRLCNVRYSASSTTAYALFGWNIGNNESQAKLFKLQSGVWSEAPSLPGSSMTRNYYNLALWVDPSNPQHVVIAGVLPLESTNGGQSFLSGPAGTSNTLAVHPDFHGLVGSPSGQRLYGLTDGGVHVFDYGVGVTWQSLNSGLVTTEFYAVAGVNEVLAGATQDNGLLVRTNGTVWTHEQGGDGFFVDVDREVPANAFGSVNQVKVLRINSQSHEKAVISCWTYAGGCGGTSPAAGDIPIIPFRLDPLDTRRAVASYYDLDPVSTQIRSEYRTAYGVQTGSWDPVSSPQPSWLPTPLPSGATVSLNSDAVGFVTGIRPDAPLLFEDSSYAWVKCTGWRAPLNTNCINVPPFSDASGVFYPTSVVISHRNSNTWFATSAGFDGKAIRKSTDGGGTWTSISTGLPAIPAYAIAEHPLNPNFLFLATQAGMFRSRNGGASWAAMPNGPEAYPVSDLAWASSTTLVASTIGRGVFKADIPTSCDVAATCGDIHLDVNLTKTVLSSASFETIHFAATNLYSSSAPSNLTVRVQVNEKSGATGRYSAILPPECAEVPPSPGSPPNARAFDCSLGAMPTNAVARQQITLQGTPGNSGEIIIVNVSTVGLPWIDTNGTDNLVTTNYVINLTP